MKNAQYKILKQIDGLVFIQDLNLPGYPSVTNDAEWVHDELTQQCGCNRIVYQDSQGEWAELTMEPGLRQNEWRVVFKPWYGQVWDVLSH